MVELYTRPRFLFEHLMNMDLIWIYTGIVGLAVYLIMLGAMLWTGRNREIAEKHATRLDIANRLAHMVGSTQKPETLFKTIVQEVRQVIPCERCVISTVEQENNRYTYWYTESDVEVEKRNLNIDPDEWKGEGVYDTKRPLYMPDITQERWHVHKRIAKGGIRTLLIIPVIQEDKCVAHINLSSVRVDAFPDRDDEILVSIAAHLGPAIRNATLYQTAQARADRLAVLNKLNRELSEHLDLPDLFSNIATNAVDLLEADHSSIFLYDEEAREFHLQVSKGRLPYPSDQPQIVPWDHSIITKVGMESVNIPDAQNPYLFWTDWARENGIHTFSTQPLKRQGKNIGLIICMSQKVSAFNLEDMDLLGSLAAQASVALENARLFGEEQQRADRMEVIGKIAEAVGSTLEPNELFQNIIREVRRVVPCERCVIDSLDRGNQQPWYVESNTDIPLNAPPYFSRSPEWTQQVYKTKTLANIPNLGDIQDSPRASFLSGAGFRSVLAAPILQDGKCIAHISFASTQLAAFSPAHEEFLTAISGHLGSAIRNATLFQAAEERTKRLKIVNKIAQAVGSELEPTELFKTIVREIRQVISCERCVLSSFNGKVYQTWYIESEIDVPPPPQVKFENRAHWFQEVYRSKRSVNVPNLRDTKPSPRAEFLAEAGFQSALTAPILQNEKCIAHVSLFSSQLEGFTPEHEEFLTAISGHLGSAIRNASLHKDAKARAKRLEVVNRIAQAVGSELEPTDLFKTIVREIRQVIPCERYTLASFDEATYHSWHIESEIDVLPPTPKQAEDELKSQWVQEVYEKNRPFQMPDLSHFAISPRAIVFHKAGYRSNIATPILQDGKCIAHISLSSTQTEFFTSEHEEFLTAISGHLGSAIRNASLHKEVQARAKRLEVVNKIAQAVGSKLEPDELFKTIVRQIRQIIPCERYVLASYTEGVYHPWHIESETDVHPPKQIEVKDKAHWFQEVYKKSRTFNIPHLRDFKSSPRAEVFVDAGFESIIAAPILQNDQCIAHITLASTQTEFFTSEHEEFLTAISSHLGSAIRNASLHKDAQARAKRLEVVNRIAQAVGSELEPKELFKTIVREIRQVIPCERYTISSFADQVYHSWHIESELDVHSPKQDEIARDTHWIKNVYEKNRPFRISDISLLTSSPRAKTFYKAGYRSLIVAPVIQDGECIAHISLSSAETEFFTSEHEEFLVAISSHLGSAIRNASLYQATEERAERFAALNELGQQIAQSLELEEVLQNIVQASVRLLGGIKSDIFLYDEQLSAFKLCASHGPIPNEGVQVFKLDQGNIGRAGKTGKGIIIPDVLEDSHWINSEWAEIYNLHSYICAPVQVKEKPYIVINCFSYEKNYFSEGDLELLKALASQAAIAIKNATLFEDSENNGKRLATLVGATKQLTQGLDLSQVLNSIVESAAVLFDGEAGFRLIKGEQLVRVGATPGAIPLMKKKHLNLADTTVSSKVAQTNIPFVTSDVRTEKRLIEEHRKSAQEDRTGSLLILPVKLEDRVLGTLSLYNKKGFVFDQERLVLAASLADQAAVAIENARLHEEATRGLEFFRSVVDDNADAIIMQNPERRLIHWNKSAEKLFGYTEEEALGKSIDIIFTDDDTERSKRGEAVLKAGASRHYEGVRRRKDGSQVPVEVTVSPVKDESGKVIAISSVFKDLTARKRAEEKILLALKEAEAASQAKSEFLSTMSHELRSPLNAVIGFSQLLLRDSEDPVTNQLAPKIQDSGQYLLSMIEEILDLERIEAGKIRLKVKSVAINDLTSEVVDSWHSRLPEGFCFRLQPDRSCGEIDCDSTRIKQILNNLMDNAIKYSPDGGTICISTLSKPDEVQVSVSDRGIGIKPEAKDVIFDRFQQIESGFTRRAGGLGIGLSLARDLIELQGGRIWVESKHEEGSTFTFTIPRISVAAQESLDHLGEAEVVAGMANPWDDRTILVVDDLEHYHEYMRLLMASAPRLISAYNGLEAIDAARRESPDLILMDLRMPIMDGFDAIQHLKSDPITKDIPIVAVTAQAMDEDMGRSKQAGADGFVTKPVDIPMFKTELRRVLGVPA